MKLSARYDERNLDMPLEEREMNVDFSATEATFPEDSHGWRLEITTAAGNDLEKLRSALARAVARLAPLRDSDDSPDRDDPVTEFATPAGGWLLIRSAANGIVLLFDRKLLGTSDEYIDFANDILAEIVEDLHALSEAHASSMTLKLQLDENDADTHVLQLPFTHARRFPSITATFSDETEPDSAGEDLIEGFESSGIQRASDGTFLTLGLSEAEPVDVQESTPTVRVFFGTDRLPSGKKDPNKYFGSERGPLRLGWCDVSIPDSHTIGKVEKPRWWRFEFAPNPARHVILQKITNGTEAEFLDAIRHTEDSSTRLFVFCHGYNVKFADAAKRTAQMHRDMKFDGVPILYSWPSKGQYKMYLQDSAAVEASTDNLFTFLELLATKTGAKEIHVLAHSMGSRAVSRALDRMSERPGPHPYRQVVLAAADIDAGELGGVISRLKKVSKRITLYGSSADRAIKAARKLYGATRAGDGGIALLVNPGLDSIDATKIDTSFLAHSYISDNPTLIFDVAALIEANKDPNDRKGIQARQKLGGWEFSPRQYQ
jgi:esterase/lipase superfamily enzyme